MPESSAILAGFVRSCRFAVSAVAACIVFTTFGLAATDVFETAQVEPNRPMGEAKGIFPGRVVWVHNARAVNQSAVVDAPGHGWFLPENNNEEVVEGMISSALHDLTGQATDRAAWTALFRYHNQTRGKGAVDYVRGEKIFIKLNATSAYPGGFNPADLTPLGYISETSIAPVRAMLRQLVNVVGVQQSDIYVGDPLKHIYKHLYEVWHAEFPNVHYLDNGGYTNLGRETVLPSSTAIIHYSDRGTVLKTNVWANGYGGDNPVMQDNLYRIFEDAEYLINIPMLKGHRRAGVTMFAKNHFGSHTRSDASHLHNGLIAPTEVPNVTRGGYGLYRVQVDIMGHALLGRKNLLFLMDALWATDHELDIPLKWQMPPFGNTYMASIFASLDPVAIESVGYDFLRAEFTKDRVPLAGTYVQMSGVDDYLHQAADPATWPAGIKYDPDNSGTPIKSLGTHEHWNNRTARQYSRNLSPAGRGIELIQREQGVSAGAVQSLAVRSQSTATFTVIATGTPPFTYHWQRKVSGSADWSALADGDTYSGTSTSSLEVKTAADGAADGDQYRCLISDAGGSSTVTNAATLFVAQPAIGHLVNLSARAYCTEGDRVAIGGFVVTGGARRVLIRAVGPSLTRSGLRAEDVLADPVIEVHDAHQNNAVIAANDDWTRAEDPGAITRAAAQLGASEFSTDDRTSSALLVSLPAGVYTFVARGKPGASGIVLVEVYAADQGPGETGQLVNLAARADCQTGDRATIGGFVISGGSKRVLVRAVGASLSAQGVSGADLLQDPVVELHDATHANAVIAQNDNWTSVHNLDQLGAFCRMTGATELAAEDSTSSALLVTLSPGPYSFVVNGAAKTTGIVLVEVYDAD